MWMKYRYGAGILALMLAVSTAAAITLKCPSTKSELLQLRVADNSPPVSDKIHWMVPNTVADLPMSQNDFAILINRLSSIKYKEINALVDSQQHTIFISCVLFVLPNNAVTLTIGGNYNGNDVNKCNFDSEFLNDRQFAICHDPKDLEQCAIKCS